MDCELTLWRSTRELGDCIGEKYKTLEAERKALEVRRIDSEKKTEFNLSKSISGYEYSPDEIERNKTGHLFELYRQFECFRQRPTLGTLATITQISCQIHMTKQRVEMLKRLLND